MRRDRRASSERPIHLARDLATILPSGTLAWRLGLWLFRGKRPGRIALVPARPYSTHSRRGGDPLLGPGHQRHSSAIGLASKDRRTAQLPEPPSSACGAHQKRDTKIWPSETGHRNAPSVVSFRTPRPGHVCAMPRYRAVLSGIHMLDGGVCVALASLLSCLAERADRACACWSPAHDLMPLFTPHDSGRPNRAGFLVPRFESCRPSSSPMFEER
jgi:hypothetical protein